MAHQVKFKGTPKNLAGTEVKAGAAAPEFACVTQGLEVVTLATTPKKARLFSAVPSLDTPVCSLETKKFDDAIASLKDQVACYTISLDLPFAQKRYCGDQKIASMQTLSDVHNMSFAKNWGVLLEGLPIPLLARAVFVVDKNNKVTYVEYVSEVTSEPNYDAAVAALKAAV
ncbi:MAG TPA: thiol peroxidase [Gemmataceae bacterium]|nr:thiol peroxidase [Gemmataceae bacterium]